MHICLLSTTSGVDMASTYSWVMMHGGMVEPPAEQKKKYIPKGTSPAARAPSLWVWRYLPLLIRAQRWLAPGGANTICRYRVWKMFAAEQNWTILEVVSIWKRNRAVPLPELFFSPLPAQQPSQEHPVTAGRGGGGRKCTSVSYPRPAGWIWHPHIVG